MIMSRPYTALVSRVIFPLQERLKKHTTVSVHRAMEKSQWWSPEQLGEYQLSRLRQFLTNVEARVPYYRNLFRERGFKPGCLTSSSDLAQLPLLDKRLIRENMNLLRADDAQGLTRFTTGGSSGEPLAFLIGKERISHDVAAKWRATRWWDVDIGDPEIVVWGSPIELAAQDHARLMRDRLMRTELLPAFEMSETRLTEYVEQIRRRRPKMLFGYPSSLALIGRHSKIIGVDLSNLEIKVAFVTSERLFDDQRATIRDAFGCPVANGYGARDAGFIAHECPQGGMHITSEDIVVEIVDTDDKALALGSSGEIVVTHLATGDFPFVRYKTGDLGTLDSRLCRCGRGLPLLKNIEGRSTDFLIAEDGTVMHGLAAIYPIRDLSEVVEFVVVQESLHRTCVTVVPGPGYGPRSAEKIVIGLKSRLGMNVEIVVQAVDQIPRTASGKHRYVISKIASR